MAGRPVQEQPAWGVGTEGPTSKPRVGASCQFPDRSERSFMLKLRVNE